MDKWEDAFVDDEAFPPPPLSESGYKLAVVEHHASPLVAFADSY